MPERLDHFGQHLTAKHDPLAFHGHGVIIDLTAMGAFENSELLGGLDR